MTSIFGNGPNLVGNYVTEVAASFLFGLGYYMFKGSKQNPEKNEVNKITEKDKLKQVKFRLDENIKKFETIKTIEEFNKILQNQHENFDAQEILSVITSKGLTPNIETFNYLLISSFFHRKFEEAFILKNEMLDQTGPVNPNSQTLNIIIKGYGLYYKHLEKYDIEISKEDLCKEYDNQIEKILKNFIERGIKPEIICLNYILEILFEQGRSEDLWDFYEEFIEAEKNPKKLTNFNNGNNIQIQHSNSNQNDNQTNNFSAIASSSASDSAISYQRNSNLKIFNEIPPIKVEGDSHTYSILLKNLKSLFLFEEKSNKPSNSNSIVFNEVTFSKDSSVFKNWLKRFLQAAENLAKLKSFKLEENTYDNIIELCIKFNKIEEAEFYFKNLLQITNCQIREYTFCLMIKAYAKIYQLEKCIEIFNFLKLNKQKNLEIKNLNLNNNQIEKIDEIFDDSVSIKSSQTSFTDKYNNPNPTIISYSSIMSACIRCNDIKKCEEYAKEIEKNNIQKNAFIYSILINGYRKSKQHSKAINLYDNLVNFLNMKNFSYQLTKNNKSIEKNKEAEITPKLQELSITLGNDEKNINNKNNNLNINSNFHSESILTEKENPGYLKEKEEEKINIVLFNSILDCCVDCERYEKMSEIFGFLNEYAKKNDTNIYKISPDLITYSTIMKGYAKANQVKKVMEIYNFLLKEKQNEFKLDSFLFNILLDSMAKNKDNEGMIKIYSDMKNMGIETSIITYGILIKFYVNLNDLENCIELYEDLINKGLKPSIIIYQLMIKLYSKNKMSYKCIDIYKNMILMGIIPDEMILNTIIRICYDNLLMKEALEIINSTFSNRIKLENEYYDYIIEYLIYADDIENDIAFNQFNNEDRDLLDYNERIKGLEGIIQGCENIGVILSYECKNEIRNFLQKEKFNQNNIKKNNNNYNNNKFDFNKEKEKEFVFDNSNKNNKNKIYIEEDSLSTISKNLCNNNDFKELNYEYEVDFQNNSKSFFPKDMNINNNNDYNQSKNQYNNNNNYKNNKNKYNSYNNNINNNNYYNNNNNNDYQSYNNNKNFNKGNYNENQYNNNINNNNNYNNGRNKYQGKQIGNGYGKERSLYE
jgi:pentatricopeptide repeat protein